MPNKQAKFNLIFIIVLFSTVILTGCGVDSCQACRDDCARNGIRPSDCNCAGCN